MAIDFPNSPTSNQIYTSGGRSWIWNGSYWVAYTTTITTDLIANGTITSDMIANGTIVAADIANYTISNTKIANASITNTQIASATITNTQIASGTITNTQLAANVAATNLGFTPASTGKSIAMAIVFGG